RDLHSFPTRRSSDLLILLPGLGADQTLFEPQRGALPPFEVPPWLSPQPAESLAAFGERMAAACGPPDPTVIGGVSFGGMVAIEMARHLRPRAVVLIASCTTGAALPPLQRALLRIGAALPVRALRPPRIAWPLVARG